ncbi:hypothetical protein ACWCQS_13200 [Streptomyces sp. NPDC002076]
MAAVASTLMPATPSQAADTSVTVDFATAGGAPTYHASSMIYGMTPDGSLPQDHFFVRAAPARPVGRGRDHSQGWPGDNGDWTQFDNFVTQLLNDVKTNDVATDIYSWQDEPGDPSTDVGRANATLSAPGLTNTRPYQINEYVTPSMQSLGGGAWSNGRLERAGADGLRGSWASGTALHDDEANLLNAKDGYTVTLLPPSNTTTSTVAASENSGQCLDDTNLSTANEYICNTSATSPPRPAR